MKKNGLGFALLIVAVLSISGCKQPSLNATQPVATNQQERLQQDVVNRVYEIYREVFTVYNAWSKDDAAVNLSNYDFDSQYCSRDWNDIVKRVKDFDDSHDEIEMGFFDADYWVMGQDANELSISDVRLIDLQQDRAQVEFNLKNCGSISLVRLEMVLEGGEWRIDNFIDIDHNYGDINWKANMKDYLKNNYAQ